MGTPPQRAADSCFWGGMRSGDGCCAHPNEDLPVAIPPPDRPPDRGRCCVVYVPASDGNRQRFSLAGESCVNRFPRGMRVVHGSRAAPRGLFQQPQMVIAKQRTTPHAVSERTSAMFLETVAWESSMVTAGRALRRSLTLPRCARRGRHHAGLRASSGPDHRVQPHC